MKVLSKLLEVLVAEMNRTAETVGVEAVHDLRVSVRRASEGLRIFGDQVKHARRLRREIGPIREMAAAVRDRDVTRQLLRRNRLPAGDPACIYLQGQRDLAASQLQEFLRSQLREDRPRRLVALSGEVSAKLEPLVTTFFSAGRSAAASGKAQDLHAFRIRAKRLRYTIEILDPEGGGEWLARLRNVQQKLGDMNDAFVAEQYLRALPIRSALARPLAARLRAEADAHCAAFGKTWRRRFGERTEEAWLAWARSVEP